jgi:hypothetical protein
MTELTTVPGWTGLGADAGTALADSPEVASLDMATF